MPQYTLNQFPQQLASRDAASTTLTNLGDASIWIDSSSSVSATSAGMVLAPRQSVPWNGGANLWAVCAAGETGLLGLAESTGATTSPDVRIDGPVNALITGPVDAVITGPVDVYGAVQSTTGTDVLFSYPVTYTTSDDAYTHAARINVEKYAALIISNSWAGGSTINGNVQFAIQWFDANDNVIFSETIVTAADSLAASNEQRILLVKGSSFNLVGMGGNPIDLAYKGTTIQGSTSPLIPGYRMRSTTIGGSFWTINDPAVDGPGDVTKAVCTTAATGTRRALMPTTAGPAQIYASVFAGGSDGYIYISPLPYDGTVIWLKDVTAGTRYTFDAVLPSRPCLIGWTPSTNAATTLNMGISSGIMF